MITLKSQDIFSFKHGSFRLFHAVFIANQLHVKIHIGHVKTLKTVSDEDRESRKLQLNAINLIYVQQQLVIHST